MDPTTAIILADFVVGLVNSLIRDIQGSDAMTPEQQAAALAKLKTDLQASHEAVQALTGG